MRAAQRVGGLVVAPVRRPAVVHRHPPEPWQHPGGLHRVRAALGVHREPAQQLGRRRVDPVQPAGDPGAGLVEMGDLGGGELRTDRLGEPAQPRRALGQHRGQRAAGHARAQHLRQQLTGPLHRQVLPGQQVAAQRADPRPIARRRARLVGEARGGHPPAPAPAPLGPMLGRPQPHLGQVENLPRLHPDNRRERQVRAAPWHRSGMWTTTSSGSGTWARCAPGAPGCLPGLRPPARRSRRGAGGLPSPSEDGVWRSCASAGQAGAPAQRSAPAAPGSPRPARQSRGPARRWRPAARRSPPGRPRQRHDQDRRQTTRSQPPSKSSGQARLPKGPRESYPTIPQAVNPAQSTTDGPPE
jgi:hypothetical protein